MNHSEMRKSLYLPFFKSSDFGFRGKQVFFLQYLVDILPLDPDPWIRTFLRIRIQKAKILWIQRIRILSTACLLVFLIIVCLICS